MHPLTHACIEPCGVYSSDSLLILPLSHPLILTSPSPTEHSTQLLLSNSFPYRFSHSRVACGSGWCGCGCGFDGVVEFWECVGDITDSIIYNIINIS